MAIVGLIEGQLPDLLATSHYLSPKQGIGTDRVGYPAWPADPSLQKGAGRKTSLDRTGWIATNTLWVAPSCQTLLSSQLTTQARFVIDGI